MIYKPTGILISDNGLYGRIYYTQEGTGEIETFKLSEERSIEYFEVLERMLELDLANKLIKWGWSK